MAIGWVGITGLNGDSCGGARTGAGRGSIGDVVTDGIWKCIAVEVDGILKIDVVGILVIGGICDINGAVVTGRFNGAA